MFVIPACAGMIFTQVEVNLGRLMSFGPQPDFCLNGQDVIGLKSIYLSNNERRVPKAHKNAHRQCLLQSAVLNLHLFQPG